MNKGILIGVGVLAVLGVGGFFWWKSRNKSETSSDLGDMTKSAEQGASSDEASVEEALESSDITEPASKKEARKQKRQKRRDCRAEAKAKGLKGKAKRQFKSECKAQGGVSDEFVTDESDFAFNGFASFD